MRDRCEILYSAVACALVSARPQSKYERDLVEWVRDITDLKDAAAIRHVAASACEEYDIRRADKSTELYTIDENGIPRWI